MCLLGNPLCTETLFDCSFCSLFFIRTFFLFVQFFFSILYCHSMSPSSHYAYTCIYFICEYKYTFDIVWQQWVVLNQYCKKLSTNSITISINYLFEFELFIFHWEMYTIYCMHAVSKRANWFLCTYIYQHLYVFGTKVLNGGDPMLQWTTHCNVLETYWSSNECHELWWQHIHLVQS